MQDVSKLNGLHDVNGCYIKCSIAYVFILFQIFQIFQYLFKVM